MSALFLLSLPGCGTKDAPEPSYIQDRRVRTFDIRPPTKARLDSIQRGLLHPDSSGWYLVWTRPLDSKGWVRVYLFADSLRGDVRSERLQNGRAPIDVSGLRLIAIRDTTAEEEDSIQIPSSVFRGLQGNAIRADTTYNFSIWVQYLDGEVAPPSVRPFSRGDIYPPASAGPIAESIGSTRATLSWRRPADQVGEFDTEFNGPFRSIHVAAWADTSGTCRTPGPVELPKQDSVLRRWCRESRSDPEAFRGRYPVDFARCDTSLASVNADTQRIALDGLLPTHSYRYVVVVVDSAGLSTQSLIGCLRTRDPHPPTPPRGLSIEPGMTSNRIVLRFQAASDSFAGTAAVYTANYDIQRYVVEVNGRRFDSLVLARRPAPGFVDTTTDRSGRLWGAWEWNGSSWSWSHALFEPSTAYAFRVWAVDSSGNDVRSDSSIQANTPARVAGAAACPPGWIPVGGGTGILHGTLDSGTLKRDTSLRAVRIALSDYCIEKFEHGGSRSRSAVTWSEAVEICEAFTDTLRRRNLLQPGDSIELCSEAQWERACRGTTGADYGAVGLPKGSSADTLLALRDPCALGSNDPRVDTSSPPRDPVCQSEWGVRDLVGRLGEWTRDVYHTRGNQMLPAQTDPVHSGASDLTGDATLGTLRGGSFLVLQDTTWTLPSARCWERTYPAFNVVDTTTKLRRPNPAMTSQGIGFRCCLRRGP